MRRILMLAALVAALATTARAAADPVTVETKWNTNTFSISTTGVTSLTIDLGGFGTTAYAIIGQQYVQNGLDGTTYGRTATVSTNTTNVVGFSWGALAVGANASMQITQVLTTPPPVGLVRTSTAALAFQNPFPQAWTSSIPYISTSSVITLPNGVPMSDTFAAIVMNPKFIFTGLTAAATLYFSADLGTPHRQ